MAWSTFFGVVIGVYAIYYVLNLLYDLFFSRRQKAPGESSVHYNMGELRGEEEAFYQVTEGLEEEEPGYNDQHYDGQEEEEYDEDYDDEQQQGYAEEAPPAPVLKVEGQGIPLDEFLRDAKAYSNSIF